MTTTFVSKMMVGLAVLGDALKMDPASIAAIISNRFDTEMKCVFFIKYFPAFPDTEEELNHPDVLLALERLKEMFRAPIRRALEFESTRIKMEKDMERLKKMRIANSPHEMGTVAEIAQRYGITKAEVRRRKAAGTLHELNSTP